MKIHIENYRNIGTLDYEPEINKVNFIFGICGSGKSSLIDAISESVKEQDISVGKTRDDLYISIDGLSPDNYSASTYNLKRQNALFMNSPTNEYYEIFIGDTNILEKLEEDYEKLLFEVQSYLPDLFDFQSKVNELARALGKPGARGSYTPKSKLGKMLDAFHETTPEAKQSISGLGQKHISWILKGFDDTNGFENHICPFCAQKLDEETFSRLEAIKAMDTSTVKTFYQSGDLLSSLKITEPDFDSEDDLERIKDEIAQLFLVQNDIDSIIELCQRPRSLESLKNDFDPINIHSETKMRFPKLESIVQQINDKNIEIKKLLGKMATEFREIIDKNARAINTKLFELGVPYRFIVGSANRQDELASYVLKHNDSESNTDMREVLSTGEKNLVSLLLFLFRESNDIVLIDDPASSFDDYRRSQLFRSIMQCQGKTIIVVSHDQAFVKRAAHSNHSRIGKIQQMFQRNGKISFKDITKESFGSFDDFVKDKIRTSQQYYQKILNIRLYVDLHRKEFSEAIWGYTSAILHGETVQAITSELGDSGLIENDVIGELEKAFEVKLEAYNPADIVGVNYQSLSPFEQLIIKREHLRIINGQVGRTAEEQNNYNMLCDLVHMNDSMLVSLNPYEYEI